MALLTPHASNSLRHTTPSRTKVVLTAYVVLTWFTLALSGSILGTFVQKRGDPPLMIFLAAGGPVILFVAGYLLSDAFRSFVCSLIGDPWGITALQAYRVVGVVFIQKKLLRLRPL